MRAHREWLRLQGLRPIRVPDVRSPAFKAEAHWQFLAVAQSQHESEDQAFSDALSDGIPNEAQRSRSWNARLQDLTPEAANEAQRSRSRNARLQDLTPEAACKT